MHHRSGFTLIEMSIVLIIIGLIIGGIVVGRDLIHAAQIRQQAKQFESINAAVYTFKAKYNCLPGDCPNATEFFGALATPTNGVACASVPSNGTLTCDGNGDGQIAPVPLGQPPTIEQGSNYEMGHFWVQLSAAYLFPGNYNGLVDITYNSGTPGVNFPATTIGSDTGIQLTSLPTGGIYGGDIFRWPITISGHVFEVGAMSNGGGSTGPWLSASDAFMLDSKIDDGLPSSGILHAWAPAYAPLCATAWDNAQYQSGTAIACNFYWIAGF